jgi:TRAP-type mannitol/chloroaromatic compound transport system permease small subunit
MFEFVFYGSGYGIWRVDTFYDENSHKEIYWLKHLHDSFPLMPFCMVLC